MVKSKIEAIIKGYIDEYLNLDKNLFKKNKNILYKYNSLGLLNSKGELGEYSYNINSDKRNEAFYHAYNFYKKKYDLDILYFRGVEKLNCMYKTLNEYDKILPVEIIDKIYQINLDKKYYYYDIYSTNKYVGYIRYIYKKYIKQYIMDTTIEEGPSYIYTIDNVPQFISVPVPYFYNNEKYIFYLILYYV